MPLIMIPARTISSLFQLESYDLRPYHLAMAILHIAYLFGTYMLLAKEFGRNFSTLFSFAATVPNFIFFSYSPFISHDIFPGMLLLAMIYYTGKYIQRRDAKFLLIMVITGSIAATIKHIYGVFWIAILLSYIVIIFINKHDNRDYRKCAELFAAAIVSGVITWLLITWSLRGVYQETTLLFRPVEQLEYLADAYGSHSFPIWVYFRNTWAYGIIAAAILPLGIWMSWWGNLTQKTAVIVFVTIIIVMHMIEAREVRYLAHLSPVMAFLIVPAIRMISNQFTVRLFLVFSLLITILPFHQYSIAAEAMRILNPFYQRSLLHNLQTELDPAKDIFLLTNASKFSFITPFPTPFKGDAYHRMFHIDVNHLPFLLGNDSVSVSRIAHPAQLDYLDSWPEQTIIHITNAMLSNPDTWEGGSPVGIDGFYRIFLFNDHLSISRNTSNSFIALDSNNKIIDTKVRIDKLKFINIHSKDIAALLSNSLYPRVDIGIKSSDKITTHGIRLLPDNGYEILYTENLTIDSILSQSSTMKLRYFKQL
jgi:hypothetical protein